MEASRYDWYIMKAFALFFLVAAVIGFAVVPVVSVFAQWTPGNPLVPESCQDGVSCNFQSLLCLGNNVIHFLVYVTVFIAAAMFMYAGFKYVMAGGNSGQISQVHKIFTNGAIGLIFVLAAWLIVSTLMNSLVNGNYMPSWNMQCDAVSGGTAQQPSGGQPSGGVVVSPSTIGGAGAPVSHSEALGAFNQAGVQVSSTAGPSGVQANCTGAGCTSLEGIRENTVQEIVTFKSGCDAWASANGYGSCSVVVTGGTEGGVHSETAGHSTGHKIDIDDTTAVNAYIESTFLSAGTRGDGSTLYVSPDTGETYAKEGTHWDVLVN
jgi:ABC-type nickel/cobalt efflux system permease component RcnA